MEVEWIKWWNIVPRAVINPCVQSAVLSHVEYLSSMFSKNLSPSGLEMAEYHARTLGQKPLIQRPKPVFVQLSGAKEQETHSLRGNWCLIVYWESSLRTKSQVARWNEFHCLLIPPWTAFFEFHCTWHLVWHGDSSRQMFPLEHICPLFFGAIWCISPRVGEAGSNTHEDTIHWRLWRAGMVEKSSSGETKSYGRDGGCWLWAISLQLSRLSGLGLGTDLNTFEKELSSQQGLSWSDFWSRSSSEQQLFCGEEKTLMEHHVFIVKKKKKKDLLDATHPFWIPCWVKETSAEWNEAPNWSWMTGNDVEPRLTPIRDSRNKGSSYILSQLFLVC